jgi:hypothetical protein
MVRRKNSSDQRDSSLPAAHSIDLIAYRCRAWYLWARARDLVLKLGRPQSFSLLRDIAEAINGIIVNDDTESSPVTDWLLGEGREYTWYSCPAGDDQRAECDL